MSPAWLTYVEWDLSYTGLLPHGWKQDITEAVTKFGKWTALSGDSSVSRERVDVQTMFHVRVATGEIVENRAPWLSRLYAGVLRNFVSTKLRRRYYVAKDKRSSININYLSGTGAIYERHVDSNPLTGLLFVTGCTKWAGGELVFLGPQCSRFVVHPRPGLFIAFDARKTVHYVAPLRQSTTRISVPMNYYEHLYRQPRPVDLDTYLYTPMAVPTEKVDEYRR